jgi:hypothetical protein
MVRFRSQSASFLFYVALMGANSLATIPVDAKTWMVAATTFLLSLHWRRWGWKQTSATDRE